MRQANDSSKTSSACFRGHGALPLDQAGMPTTVLVDYIDQHRDRFGVEPIRAVLEAAGVQIAPSICYAAKARPPSARSVRDAELVAAIKVAHWANLGVYGACRSAEFNRECVQVARCTVERLMRGRGSARESARDDRRTHDR